MVCREPVFVLPDKELLALEEEEEENTLRLESREENEDLGSMGEGIREGVCASATLARRGDAEEVLVTSHDLSSDD